MITINFTPLHGLIQEKERDSLHFSFKTTHLILLTTVVDLNTHPQSSGGQIGGIELLKMQMVLMDGLYKLNSWRK